MKRVLLPVALLLAASCSTPPPPRATDAQPSVDLPPHYLAAPTDADGALTTDWWRQFGDPDLDAAIAAALAENRDLQGSAARLEAALANTTIAGAAALPQVDASLDAARARRLFLGFPFGGGGVPSSTTTTFGAALNVRWELDLWGRVRSGEQAAIAEAEAAANRHDAARLSLAGQTAKAYFATVEARQQLALAIASTDSIRGTTDDVRDRYRRGLRPALDAHLAETNLANAEASVALRREQLQRALRQLDLLCGRYPAAAANGAAVLPDRLPPVPTRLPAELLQRRPDLAAAERTLAAAGCRVDTARAALYPRLSLTASAGTNSTEFADLVDEDFRVFSLGANLLQPLFAGGALRAEVAQQQARQRAAIADYQQAVLVAFAEVENALGATLELDRRQLDLARAARSAAAARDLARDRWQQGLTDFLAVADGQRQAFTAEANRIAVARQRLDNHIDLVLALGGGYAATGAGDQP